MTKKQIGQMAIDALIAEYPEAICSLEADNPLHLLIATRLSAQCTDARVNQVTPALFKKYRDVDDFAGADVRDIEKIIYSCGFYQTKARDIIGMCAMIKEEFEGVVPDNIEDLTKLPGVGRKTANLIVGDVYKKPAVVADTHLIRLSNRLGLVQTKNPLKVEMELRKILAPEESNDFCHRCVLHGRAVCTSRKAKCEICCMNGFCKKIIA